MGIDDDTRRAGQTDDRVATETLTALHRFEEVGIGAVGELEIDKEQSKVVSNIFRWYIEGASVLVIIKKLADAEIKSPMGKGKWNKRAIETMLANEKYTGTVTLLDSSTQELAYQMKECLPPIITEVEFRAVQKERARRSNVVVDEKGIFQRKSKKYSSKKVTS